MNSQFSNKNNLIGLKTDQFDDISTYCCASTNIILKNDPVCFKIEHLSNKNRLSVILGWKHILLRDNTYLEFPGTLWVL